MSAAAKRKTSKQSASTVARRESFGGVNLSRSTIDAARRERVPGEAGLSYYTARGACRFTAPTRRRKRWIELPSGLSYLKRRFKFLNLLPNQELSKVIVQNTHNMRFVQRVLAPAVLEAARKFSAVVVTGPRRAGKTTLLRHTFPGVEYVLLQDPNVQARARADPRGLLEELRQPVLYRRDSKCAGVVRLHPHTD
jgi:hypothetical protein